MNFVCEWCLAPLTRICAQLRDKEAIKEGAGAEVVGDCRRCGRVWGRRPGKED